MFHTIHVSSHILGSVYPLLLSVPFLNIIFELSFVLGAIYMSILSIPIGHIVFKFSFVNITFRMPESPLALRFVVRPLALVVRPVIPVLHAVTVSNYVW